MWFSGLALAVGLGGFLGSYVPAAAPFAVALQIAGFCVTVIAAPVFGYELAVDALVRRVPALERLSVDMAESVDRATKKSTAHIDEALGGYLAAVAAGQHLETDPGLTATGRKIVSDICLPISARTVAMHQGRPLMTALSMHLTLMAIEPAPIGLLAVIERDIEFDVPRLGTLTWDLIAPPTLVVDYRALNMKTLTTLASRGKVDLLWPVNHEWLEVAGRDVPQIEWLRVTRLTVGGVDLSFPMAHPGTAAEFRQLLSAAEDESLGELDGIREATLEVGGVEPPVGAEALPSGRAAVHVQSQSTYRVWVRDLADHDLFRYVVPFWGPATVAQIRFQLGTDVRRHIRLDPATENTSFRLRQEAARFHGQDQGLTWDYGADTGTPFLPGHGVSFYWKSIDDDWLRDLSARAAALAAG